MTTASTVTLCVPHRYVQLFSAAVDLILTAASTVTLCVSHRHLHLNSVCNTQIYSAAVDLILTTGNTVSMYDTFISICIVYNTQMYPATGDLILMAASTVTSCVSHSYSGYLTSVLMRCTVCLHNSNVTGRDTQFCVKYL